MVFCVKPLSFPATSLILSSALSNIISISRIPFKHPINPVYITYGTKAAPFSPTFQVVRYEDFRKKNSSLYQGVECFKLNKLKHVYAGMLPENPVNGRITLMRFGKKKL